MDAIREILFPSDLSEESDAAFLHVKLIAERFRARVTLFHAVTLPSREYAEWFEGNEAEVWRRVEARAREHLQRLGGSVTVPFEVAVTHDSVGVHLLADLAVLDRIHRTRPDLTVMATQSRKGFSSFFVGSVAQEVVRHAGRPVLCARRMKQDPPAPYASILVPTDLSAGSRRAFPVAALLARAFGSRVTALHVAATQPSAGELQRFLEPDFAGVDVQVRVESEGRAWDHITRTARGMDMIVLSALGSDGRGDAIFGSTTERVLRHARCPVLVA